MLILSSLIYCVCCCHALFSCHRAWDGGGGGGAPAPASCDSDLSDLYLIEIIGEGASGVVLRGMLATTPVAVGAGARV